jgi:cobyrinic acid a,c-diamide synthase
MPLAMNVPRLVVGATASGVGKTTVAVGLCAALRARGLRVAVFKCGPDYLDPTYLSRAGGVEAHNLDGWMMGRQAVLATFARAARGFDIALVEGMMGLFDSTAPNTEEGSTAELAKWLDAPVLLVAEASGIARSVAAIAQGYARFDPALRVAGLICNRVGSRGHLDLLRAASAEVPVVGGLPTRDDLAFPERHLGLRTADEQAVPQPLFDAWGALIAEWFDLDAIVAIARSAAPIDAAALPVAPPADVRTSRCRIGLARDGAFHFYYEDNLNRLQALGAELVTFAPSRDELLPEVDGLYFGGGYPEALARELAANTTMLAAIRAFARAGRPVYAECGGLMYLSEGITTLDGMTWPMVGLVSGIAVMSKRLRALGYVEVETCAPSILGPAGTRFRGHQFRYSTLERKASAPVECLYRVRPRWGGGDFAEGYLVNNLVASYVHAHWASNPRVAEEFVRACARK